MHSTYDMVQANLQANMENIRHTVDVLPTKYHPTKNFSLFVYLLLFRPFSILTYDEVKGCRNICLWTKLHYPDKALATGPSCAKYVQYRMRVFYVPQPEIHTLSLYCGCASACTADHQPCMLSACTEHTLYRVRLQRHHHSGIWAM